MALIALTEIKRTCTVILARSETVGVIVVDKIDVRVTPVCAFWFEDSTFLKLVSVKIPVAKLVF